MNVVPLATFFALTVADTCIRFLKNPEERKIFQTVPGHIWRWNSFTEEFEEIQAVQLNGTAVCSVEMANNLRGRTIAVAVDTMHPYILRNSNNTGVTGFMGDIWTTLEETLGFKTIYRKAGPSASQTLMNGHAHALLLATVIYSDTSGYYTYSTPITTISYALFVQSDGTWVSQQWYANAFSRGLWLVILIFLLVTTVSLLGVHCLKKITRANYAQDDHEFSSASFSLLVVLGSLCGQGKESFSLLVVLGSQCGQGCERVPTSWPLRLIVLSHLITGLLLTGGFSSTLTSYLAIRGSSVPLNSLEDALQKRSHSVCERIARFAVKQQHAVVCILQNGSPRGDVRKEWKDLVNINCPDMRDSSALDTQLCKPGLTFLEAPDVFLPIYRRVQHACSIVQTPDHYQSLKISFLHSRLAEHRHLIDTYLMRFHSAGILKYLERKWLSKGIRSSEDDQSSLQPVEYAHIHLLFLGLIYMAIFSVFICVLENIWYKLQVKKQFFQFNTILHI